jgi:hypothetical protein
MAQVAKSRAKITRIASYKKVVINTECKIIDKSDYAGEMIINKYHITLKFYTRKQIKSTYPNKNYRVVGEVGNQTGVQCSTAENLDGQSLPVYKEGTHYWLTESVTGYAAVDDHTYLAVVKNKLIQRMMILFICIIVITSLLIYTSLHF